MNKEFTVEISSFLKISLIANTWTTDDYKALLSMVDIVGDELSGMGQAELKEMCLMSFNDLKAHESAKLLLAHIFKDESDMTEGKIDQMSHKMADNNLWEEHADPAYHMRLFNGYGLLREAYNGTFTEPTGVKFTVKITADKEESFALFEPSPHAVIVRLLAAGLKESAILNRLFAEKISGDNFPDAANILWIVKEIATAEKERQYEITSSYLWFGDFENTTRFTADAHADAQEEAAESAEAEIK